MNKYCTNRYSKKHTHNISAQSIQRFWRSCVHRFEFNQRGCLGTVMQNLSRQCTARCPKNHTHKISAHPFSGFRGAVSTRFEFNWHSCLGAVTQKLSRYGTISYAKELIHKISAQSLQWFMRNCGLKISVQSAQPFRSSYSKTKQIGHNKGS